MAGNDELRILVVAATEMQGQICMRLSSLGVAPILASRASELAHFVRGGEIYRVVLLPAVLPDSDWRAIWGEHELLTHKPSILVYARTASFELWSGVRAIALGFSAILVAHVAPEKSPSVRARLQSCRKAAINPWALEHFLLKCLQRP